MKKTAAIAIFDVGKTNKKVLLFDEDYKIAYQQSKNFDEVIDEDGFACEDIVALTNWLQTSFNEILANEKYTIKAVSFSAYGASFVYIDKDGKVLLPLYNYLKPYPQALQNNFYATNGGQSQLARQTASPVLGNLNSGMQLYRLKHEKPELFAKIKYALHLPQYLSYILCGAVSTDITSIGCHTGLWNFQNNNYHAWVTKEGIDKKFAPIKDCSKVAGNADNNIVVGGGLHDSSAALIPYLSAFKEPFILLSTGTWCISLNPFNSSLLTDYELHQDCLCYLTFKGKPVKASRLFAGNEHEQQAKILATHFNKPVDYYTQVAPNIALLNKIKNTNTATKKSDETVMIGQSQFGSRALSSFANYEEAYHQLIADIMVQQVRSTNIVLLGTKVQRIFVDGGFSKNLIYMHLLADAFSEIEVYAASVAQASALGAAMVLHKHWNTKKLPADCIDLKLYTRVHENSL